MKPGPGNQSRPVYKGKNWEYTGPTFTIVIYLEDILQDMLAKTIRMQIDSLGIADVVRLQKSVTIASEAHDGTLKLGTFYNLKI